MSKTKNSLNIKKEKFPKVNLKKLAFIFNLHSNDVKSDLWIARGNLKSDIKKYKLMCSKVKEFRPMNSFYFTLSELYKRSELNAEKFEKRCWEWYISLEEDNWDPCIELCGLCAIMADKYKKYWYPKEREWKE